MIHKLNEYDEKIKRNEDKLINWACDTHGNPSRRWQSSNLWDKKQQSYVLTYNSLFSSMENKIKGQRRILKENQKSLIWYVTKKKEK